MNIGITIISVALLCAQTITIGLEDTMLKAYLSQLLLAGDEILFMLTIYSCEKYKNQLNLIFLVALVGVMIIIITACVFNFVNSIRLYLQMLKTENAIRVLLFPIELSINLILAFACVFISLHFFDNTVLSVTSNPKAKVGLLQFIYYSCTTFTSVGYGDIVPHKYVQIIACVEMLCGYFFGAIFVALAVSKISEMLKKNDSPAD